MANNEPPITLEEQVLLMKKYVSFRQRKREFLNYAGYFVQAGMESFYYQELGLSVRSLNKMHYLNCTSLM